MFERAQALAGKHTGRLGVRSLDILHVAVALELQAEAFLTFDRRQARLARAEGLPTPVRIR
jgi:predicted nucleic acid-binding protein